MIVAALIAFAASALFVFFAAVALFTLWRGVRRDLDKKVLGESVVGFWVCLIIAFVLTVLGGLLW